MNTFLPHRKYNRIYEAFGWEIPVYVHCPLITDETHAKLVQAFWAFFLRGSSGPGICIRGNCELCGTSWMESCRTTKRSSSLQELVEKFDYHHINKSPAVFDIGKLRWMNGEYIKKMDPEVFYEKALPYMKQVLTKGLLTLRRSQVWFRQESRAFPDIPALIDFFEAVPEYDASMYCHKKMKTNRRDFPYRTARKFFRFWRHRRITPTIRCFASLSEFVKEKGYKNGYVMWPLRTAVSGKQMTPAGATEIMEIIGKEETFRPV